MQETTRIIFRTHAIKRMFQRKIDDKIVRSILVSGEIIEEYSDDKPYPKGKYYEMCNL